jgi:hypothetical protein
VASRHTVLKRAQEAVMTMAMIVMVVAIKECKATRSSNTRFVYCVLSLSLRLPIERVEISKQVKPDKRQVTMLLNQSINSCRAQTQTQTRTRTAATRGGTSGGVMKVWRWLLFEEEETERERK